MVERDIKPRTRQVNVQRKLKKATVIFARLPDVARALVGGNVNLILPVASLLSFPHLLLDLYGKMVTILSDAQTLGNGDINTFSSKKKSLNFIWSKCSSFELLGSV